MESDIQQRHCNQADAHVHFPVLEEMMTPSAIDGVRKLTLEIDSRAGVIKAWSVSGILPNETAATQCDFCRNDDHRSHSPHYGYGCTGGVFDIGGHFLQICNCRVGAMPLANSPVPLAARREYLVTITREKMFCTCGFVANVYVPDPSMFFIASSRFVTDHVAAMHHGSHCYYEVIEDDVFVCLIR